jgi:hypothetical protein
MHVVELSLNELSGLLNPAATALPEAVHRQIDSLSAWSPLRGDEPVGRWQTRLALHEQVVLLVDEFKRERAEPHGLALQADAIEGGRQRFRVQGPGGAVGLHLLGVYRLAIGPNRLELQQHSIQGRFLVAITRDPEARVRVLNGWAVEVRSAGHVWHLLHSNRSCRLRPLGPFQTDALFAAAGWPAASEPDRANLLAIQARTLRIADRELRLATPGDLLWHPAASTGPS